MLRRNFFRFENIFRPHYGVFESRDRRDVSVLEKLARFWVPTRVHGNGVFQKFLHIHGERFQKVSFSITVFNVYVGRKAEPQRRIYDFKHGLDIDLNREII